MTTPELIALIEGQQRCADAARCVEVRNHHRSNIGIYATGILAKLRRLERAEELLREVQSVSLDSSSNLPPMRRELFERINAFIREVEA